MTWADVQDLSDYWKKHPPTQWLVEGWMRAQGYLDSAERHELTDEELRALAGA